MKYIDDIYTDNIYHWMMFIKHNNMGFLKKQSLNTPVNKVENDLSPESFSTYYAIRDQIVSEFGEDKHLKKERDLDFEIATLQLDYIINKDRFKQTLYQLMQSSRKPKEEAEPYDFNKELGIISKSVGGGIIDIKNTTIHQYYTAKNNLSNG